MRDLLEKLTERIERFEVLMERAQHFLEDLVPLDDAYGSGMFKVHRELLKEVRELRGYSLETDAVSPPRLLSMAGKLGAQGGYKR